MPRSGSSMVGEDNNKTTNSVELKASLAPAEAEVGAVAKADQKQWVQENFKTSITLQLYSRILPICLLHFLLSLLSWFLYILTQGSEVLLESVHI